MPLGNWGGERAGVATTVDPRGIGWAINIGEVDELLASSVLSLPPLSFDGESLEGNGPN